MYLRYQSNDFRFYSRKDILQALFDVITELKANKDTDIISAGTQEAYLTRLFLDIGNDSQDLKYAVNCIWESLNTFFKSKDISDIHILKRYRNFVDTYTIESDEDNNVKLVFNKQISTKSYLDIVTSNVYLKDEIFNVTKDGLTAVLEQYSSNFDLF